ncbi:Bifunctional bis(5'-adenosyl)-triphosphatase/adenylylsulfatase FHIT-like protein [Drosera capensis]
MMLKQVVQLLHPSSLGAARRCLGGDGIRNPFLDIRQRLRLRSIATSQMGSNGYKFGPYKIHEKEVFYSTDLSYAMVNLRPLVPDPLFVKNSFFVEITTTVGIQMSFALLTFENQAGKCETADLWLTAQKVGRQIEQYHKASSLTFAIQDGAQAGQTVPHVHIHILPRKVGDFEKNDEIYDAIDVKEKELAEKLDLDKERKDRSLEEMAEEADEYRRLFA